MVLVITQMVQMELEVKDWIGVMSLVEDLLWSNSDIWEDLGEELLVLLVDEFSTHHTGRGIFLIPYGLGPP